MEGKGGGVRGAGFLENHLGARRPGVICGQGLEVLLCTRLPRDAGRAIAPQYISFPLMRKRLLSQSLEQVLKVTPAGVEMNWTGSGSKHKLFYLDHNGLFVCMGGLIASGL